MANNSSQLWYIIHGVHVVWYTRIWGEDTPWIFIVSGSATHAHVPYAYKELAIRRTIHDGYRVHVPRVSGLMMMIT